MSGTHNSNDLAQGLKQRHVTMLSIAGVIGAGLFVGSGHAIAAAGPAVLLAYAAAGTLVVLVMRMLGEMAVASPDTGSFSTYADRAIGHWAGFTIGWLYWWFWVLVIPLEANAAATILHAWFPDVAIWVFTLVITLLLTATNLFSVKNYGEFEFWFALLKVVAIIGFIILGLAAIFGFMPNSQVSGVSHLFDTQGFMPNGLGAVLGAMLTTMFSFMGTEIVTIAAAESKNPGKQISKATNSVIWRIFLFYLVSIFIVVALVPWNAGELAEVGSYQTVLQLMGVPHAKLIVDIVVLIAVTSCLNSALYTSSRMLFSLSKRGDAPAMAQRTTSSGTVIADGLRVPAFHLFPSYRSYESPTLAGPFAQLTTAAIDAGIGRAALDDTIAFVREHARPWVDAKVEKAGDDPLTIIQVGSLEIRQEAAEALLERAGWVLDAAKPAPDEDNVAAASVAVAKAKVLTTEAALEATNRLFELGGTRSSLARHNFDRHWRNARVHTLHDPVRWKYHLVGNWALNGIKPARHDWN